MRTASVCTVFSNLLHAPDEFSLVDSETDVTSDVWTQVIQIPEVWVVVVVVTFKGDDRSFLRGYILIVESREWTYEHPHDFWGDRNSRRRDNILLPTRKVVLFREWIRPFLFWSRVNLALSLSFYLFLNDVPFFEIAPVYRTFYVYPTLTKILLRCIMKRVWNENDFRTTTS